MASDTEFASVGLTEGRSINPRIFDKVLAQIAGGCGHKHMFAVNMDSTWPTIYTTALGSECIGKVSW